VRVTPPLRRLTCWSAEWWWWSRHHWTCSWSPSRRRNATGKIFLPPANWVPCCCGRNSGPCALPVPLAGMGLYLEIKTLNVRSNTKSIWPPTSQIPLLKACEVHVKKIYLNITMSQRFWLVQTGRPAIDYNLMFPKWSLIFLPRSRSDTQCLFSLSSLSW
jgi:hypothetical protein